MKVYPYIMHVVNDTLERQDQFAGLIARRALAGGDVDQLMSLLGYLPGRISREVVSQMDGEDGCQMLHLRLWLKYNSIYEISDFEDWVSAWQNADDSDECIDFLMGRDILVRCDDCGELEFQHEARGVYHDSSSRVCRSCIDNNYRWSDRYDAYVHEDSARVAFDERGRECIIDEDDSDFEWNDDEDRYVHCDYEAGSRVIGNYHSSKGSQRPQVSPWTKMRRRYMGVELEVETPNGNRGEKAQQLHALINNEVWGQNVFFENDGSLNNGFEIISQPMGLDRHRELWSWLKDKNAVRGLRSHNTSTCGLHVHVSRDSMSKLQIAKVVSFINDPDNEPLIRAVARRYAEGYCKIKNKKMGSAAYSDDRYEAVNITPRKTIEFRIFKGSLKYESVMSAIQFTNALVDFCGRSTTSIRELKADNFLDFIRNDESGDTDILVPYLENRLELA